MQRRRLLLAAAAALALAVLAFPALAVSDSTDPSQAADALAALPSIVDASSDATTTSDADSAIVAQVNGATVDVPRDPADGVTLTPDAAAPVNVSVPGADQASNATPVDNGIVLYQNPDAGADVAVQVVPSSVLAAVPDATPTDDQPATTTDDSAADVKLFSAQDDAADPPGGVRMMTILQGPDSPTSYTFQLNVPGGGQVVDTGDGGYLVEDSTGNSVAAILAPWGRDDAGNAVPVTYTLDGNAVTMHVDTTNATFPVVADPAVIASAPAAKPAPAPAPAAPKADLQCTGFAAPWGGASNGCSVSATLSCVYGPCAVSESLGIYVDCRHCATGSLASKLAGIVKNAALWKVGAECGGNCSEGAAREIPGSKQVAVTTWKAVPQPSCSWVSVTVGRLKTLQWKCTTTNKLVLTTTYVTKPTILHTCALRAVFTPAILVPSSGDDLRYLIGASFSLSCQDSGGSAKVSLEARDSLTRLFFGS